MVSELHDAALAAIERTRDRVVLYSFLSFCAVIIGAVFLPLPPESGPLVFFCLGTLLVIATGYSIYHARTWQHRATLRAATLAEGMIRSARDVFTQVFKQSPVPYVLVTATGTIEAANTAAVRLLECPEASLLQRDVFSYFQETKTKTDLLRERFDRGVAFSDEEMCITTAKGGSVWVMVSLFHFTGISGPRGLLTFVDITRQKQVDAAKTEFISLASHQFRTPIAGLRWNTELLLSDTTTPLSFEHRAIMTRVHHSISRLATVVDDMLRVSRFELGEVTPQVKSIQIDAFLRDLMTDYEPLARDRSVALSGSPSDAATLTEARTDPQLLTMVVGNFLSNAIKYTPAQGSVTVRYQILDDDMSITVTDTGIGIPAAEQQRLFTRLFRASNARLAISEGTGLGLYIAQRATKVLCGKITFTSGEGVGSAFTVTLPRYLSEVRNVEIVD
jgi:PAS domain S-box-containing protein